MHISQKVSSKDKQLKGIVEDIVINNRTFNNQDSDREEESDSETGAKSKSNSNTNREAYPPQYYLTHMNRVNQSDIIEVNYNNSIIDQLNYIEHV